MKHVTNTRAIATTLVVLAALSPVFASAQAGAARTANVKARSDTEITNRIDALNSLVSRISAMKNISSTFIQTLTASVQTEINDLTSLKNKIDADTSTTTLRADDQSITRSYRIYALVVPQAHIAAMADRVMLLSSMFTAEGEKISARLAGSQSAPASLSTTLADYDAKIADAQAKAQSALSGTQTLRPDNGDQTVMKSNAAALKQARSDLQAAQKDLQAVRKDLTTLVKGIKALGGSASSTTPVQAQ